MYSSLVMSCARVARFERVDDVAVHDFHNPGNTNNIGDTFNFTDTFEDCAAVCER